MKEDKSETIAKVLKECFWGDYDITVETASRLLSQKDTAFERFLVTRIVADSPFPSARLRALFPPEELRVLLDSVKTTGRAEKRLTLARAIIFHEPWEYEPSWKRQ